MSLSHTSGLNTTSPCNRYLPAIFYINSQNATAVPPHNPPSKSFNKDMELFKACISKTISSEKIKQLIQQKEADPYTTMNSSVSDAEVSAYWVIENRANPNIDPVNADTFQELLNLFQRSVKPTVEQCSNSLSTRTILNSQYFAPSQPNQQASVPQPYSQPATMQTPSCYKPVQTASQPYYSTKPATLRTPSYYKPVQTASAQKLHSQPATVRSAIYSWRNKRS